MKARLHFSVLLVLTMMAWAIPFAYCQGMRGDGTKALVQSAGRDRVYDPNTETTVKGTVEEVKTMQGLWDWGGTHLDLKSDSGTFDVHLGPSSFVESKGFTFAKGDRIEVTGSKVKFQDHDAIVAREVKKGDKVLTLRNAQGTPEWSGSRRRQSTIPQSR